MRSILRAATATGVAAATLAAGLAVGPAATAAPGPAPTPTPAPAPEAAVAPAADAAVIGPTKLVYTIDGKYYTADTPVSNGLLGTITSSTAADAFAAGANYTFPAMGTTGQIRGTGAQSNLCLFVNTQYLENQIRPQNCGTSSGYLFSWEQRPSGPVLKSHAASGAYLGGGSSGIYVTRSSQYQRPVLLGLLASTESSDVTEGTARIAGGTVPSTTSVRVSWTADGRTLSRYVTPKADGSFEYDLFGLAIGDNAVKLEALEGGEVTVAHDLTVTLTVTALTAGVTVPDDRTQEAVLGGSGQAGASVEVRHGEDVLDTVPVDEDGAWSWPVPAPGVGGDYALTVRQVVRDQEAGTQEVTVPYGRGAEITEPADDGAVSDGGEVVVIGKGEKGAPFTITDAATGDVLVEDTMNAVNGSFLAQLTGLDDREYTLVLTQQGKGRNVTTDEVVVNEGVTPPVVQEFVVTNPDADEIAAGYAPNEAYTFAGRGTAGSSVTVQNSKGLVLGTVPVGEDGEWEWTRSNMGSYDWTLDFVQGKGTADAVTKRIAGFKPSASQVTPVVVTKPADVSVGYVPDRSFTFEGTARKGSTVTVQNAKGLVLGTAPVDPVTGAWSWTRTNMGSYTWTLDFVADKGQASQSVTRLAGFKPQAVAGFRVTNPDAEQIAQGYTANASYTFRGKGTTGSVVTVQNAKGLVLGTVPVGEDGEWEWTRSNMGSYVWVLDFVQDKGTDAEKTDRVNGFAPQG